MSDYAQSAQAAQDMLRYIKLTKQEVVNGFLSDQLMSELDASSVRLNELDGVDAAEIFMRFANVFIRELR